MSQQLQFKAKSRSIFKLGWIFIFSQVLISCKPNLDTGLYGGTLFKKNDGQLFKQNVRIQITFDKKYSAHVAIEDAHHQKIESIDVIWNKHHDQIKVKIPTLGQDIYQLVPAAQQSKKNNDWKCYLGSGKYSLSACFAKTEFIINATNPIDKSLTFALTGYLSAEQKPVVFEDPKSFKLSEAIEIAMARSFDSRIEYQRVIEAKEAARASYYNLVPHFYFKDLFTLASLNPASIPIYFADFIPFLIPTRWMKVTEAKDLNEAEKLTMDILRADLAYQVASVSYTYARDRISDTFYKQNFERYKLVRTHLVDLAGEDLGKIGTEFDELTFRLGPILSFVKLEENRLENALVLDKTALSMTMGFQNPLAVLDIDLEENDDSIDNAKEVTPEEQNDLVQLAIERSLELRQLDYLIDNAQQQRNEFYFNWTDPDVLPYQSISVSLVPYIAKANAFIQELMVTRTKTQSAVATKAENAVFNYNYAIQTYQVAKPGIKMIETREALLYETIMNAKTQQEVHTNAGNLQWFLNVYYPFKLKVNDTIAAYRIARAQIQRALFEEYYSRLQPPVERGSLRFGIR